MIKTLFFLPMPCPGTTYGICIPECYQLVNTYIQNSTRITCSRSTFLPSSLCFNTFGASNAPETLVTLSDAIPSMPPWMFVTLFTQKIRFGKSSSVTV